MSFYLKTLNISVIRSNVILFFRNNELLLFLARLKISTLRIPTCVDATGRQTMFLGKSIIVKFIEEMLSYLNILCTIFIYVV